MGRPALEPSSLGGRPRVTFCPNRRRTLGPDTMTRSNVRRRKPGAPRNMLNRRLEALEDRIAPSVTAGMIADLNVAPANSSPSALVEMNGSIYFVATTPEYGTELWKSDGTAAGTVLVADIVPGTGSGSPTNLVNVN